MRTLLLSLALVSCGDGRTELGTIRDIATLDSGRDSGSCMDTVLATDPTGATALALGGTHVFWGTTDGQLWTREQGNASEVAKEPSAIVAIAVDAASIFFASGPTIFSGPRGISVITPLADKQGQPSYLAVDDQAVYFIDYGSGIAAGRLMRVDKSTKVVTALMNGLDTPSGLAMDDTDLWVTASLALTPNGAAQGALLRIPKAGRGVGQVVLQGLHDPKRLAVDASSVVFLEQDFGGQRGGVRKVPKTGASGATSIADTGSELALDITLDATNAYVTTLTGSGATQHGLVRRIALDGSKNEVWATAPSQVFYTVIRNDKDAVYWTSGWPTPAPSGTPSVQKKCK